MVLYIIEMLYIGHEVDHGYSTHHCDRFMYLANVCMQHVYIAHPDPKPSEQEEQNKLLIDRCLRPRKNAN